MKTLRSDLTLTEVLKLLLEATSEVVGVRRQYVQLAALQPYEQVPLVRGQRQRADGGGEGRGLGGEDLGGGVGR
jgi:hypothetical protein